MCKYPLLVLLPVQKNKTRRIIGNADVITINCEKSKSISIYRPIFLRILFGGSKIED